MEPRDASGGVLILGGGFAGAYVARLLGNRGATIVSRENFMLYTPLLPEAASATLDPRHTVVPLRVMCPHAELLLGDLAAVDLSARTATIETADGERTVRWRELVLALGAVPRTVPVPGLADHGLSFKSLPDAINLRNHVLRELEAADAEPDEAARRAHLSFVFVGAGYAGVEALAELSDLVDDALRYYPRLRDTPRRWAIVDAAPKILPEIPPRLGEDPPHTLVGRAGVRANPLLRELDLPLDERGRVEVDEFLRVRGREHVWALGDCAQVSNTRSANADTPQC